MSPPVPVEKRKPGRPKSPRTLEKERAHAVKKNRPPWRKEPTPARKKHQEDLIESLGQALDATLKHFQSPPMPSDIVLAHASLGDESLEGYEQKITERYKEVKKAIHAGQNAGGKKLRDRAEVRKQEIFQQNKILIQKIGTPPWNVSNVAKKIHKEWEAIPLAGRIHIEDPKLPCRGDGQKKPTVRTIRHWLKPEK